MLKLSSEGGWGSKNRKKGSADLWTAPYLHKKMYRKFKIIRILTNVFISLCVRAFHTCAMKNSMIWLAKS
jgi:hypothetical protein